MMIPLVRLVLGAILAFPVLGTAQNGGVTVPPDAEGSEQNSAMFWLTSPFETKQQLILSERYLRAARGRTIVGLQVRRSTGADAALEAGHLDIEIRISAATLGPDQTSPTFARNRGASPSLMLAKTVHFMASPRSPRQPAEWRRPYAHEFVFPKPFPYAGGALCIETTTGLASTGKSSLPPPWWPVDSVRLPSLEQASTLGASCIPELLGEPAAVDSASLRIGSTTSFSLFGRTQRYSVAALAIGTQTTNIPLDAIGAPGCVAHVLGDLFMPAFIDRYPPGRHSGATVALDIPSLSSLVGVRLISQWLIPTSGANPLGLSLSNAVGSRIASSASADFALVTATSHTANRGSVRRDRLPVLRLLLADR